MNPLEDDPDPTSSEMIWWESGGHPPWKRLWIDGVDVTDRPLEEWAEPIARLTGTYHARSGRPARGRGFGI